MFLFARVLQTGLKLKREETGKGNAFSFVSKMAKII